MSIRVTVWNEFRHEKIDKAVKDIYPNGIHSVISAFLNNEEDIKATTATLDEEDHGLKDDVLNNTDILIWWGHLAQNEVKDDIVDKVFKRVMSGMGLVVLHSAHASKIFCRLSGTQAHKLSWREDEGLERIFIIDPSHPIVKGLPEYFEVPKTEMYGEYFCVAKPDELVGISWFEGGEVFRSIFSFTRGSGKVVYIRPGHETLPIFKQKEIQQVIINSVRYAFNRETPKISFRDDITLPKR